jgi:Cdc6-like AAA superfamily ATPase
VLRFQIEQSLTSNQLWDADTLLYELTGLGWSVGHTTDPKMGVIRISNGSTFRQARLLKIKDTLMEAEISFSPSDASELRTILADRGDRAFVDGVFDDSAVARAAAIAAKDRGNAGYAIYLLRIGGEKTGR